MTQKRRGPGPGTGPAPFLGPWPLGSPAQSMHTSVVHAQEISCVYTRDSFVYTQQMYSHIIISYYYIIIVNYPLAFGLPATVPDNVCSIWYTEAG